MNTPEVMGIFITRDSTLNQFVATHSDYPLKGTGQSETEALERLLDQIADYGACRPKIVRNRKRTWRIALRKLLWRSSSKFRRTSIHAIRQSPYQRKAIICRREP